MLQNTPTATPPPNKSPYRPFSRRKSSDTTNIHADLHRQVQDLQNQLDAKVCEADEANRRADYAAQRETHLKELAKRFWGEEWSGLKDFVGLFNNGDMSSDIDEIEKRILVEYGELFRGEERGRKDDERK